MSEIYKTNWNAIENRPGHYLLLPSSASVWTGFKSKQQAMTCLLVLPGWKYSKRK